MERTKERSFQLLSLVGVVLVWELLAQIVDKSSVLPSPAEVAVVLADLVADGAAFVPLGSTLMRTTLGFLLGFTMGVVYGIAAYVYPRFEEASRWLFNIALFTPTLIVIYLALVMLGQNNLTVVVLIGFVIATDVGVYMRDAFRDFDPDVVAMARSYKADLTQRIRDLYIPYLIPPMLAAGRIGFTLSWKVAFLAEVFGFSQGLGWQVRSSYTVYDIATLLAWLALFVITLLIVEQLTRFAERSVVKW